MSLTKRERKLLTRAEEECATELGILVGSKSANGHACIVILLRHLAKERRLKREAYKAIRDLDRYAAQLGKKVLQQDKANRGS